MSDRSKEQKLIYYKNAFNPRVSGKPQISRNSEFESINMAT